MGGILKGPPIASRRRMTANNAASARGEGKKVLSGGQCEVRRAKALRISFFFDPLCRNSGQARRASAVGQLPWPAHATNGERRVFGPRGRPRSLRRCQARLRRSKWSWTSLLPTASLVRHPLHGFAPRGGAGVLRSRAVRREIKFIADQRSSLPARLSPSASFPRRQNRDRPSGTKTPSHAPRSGAARSRLHRAVAKAQRLGRRLQASDTAASVPWAVWNCSIQHQACDSKAGSFQFQFHHHALAGCVRACELKAALKSPSAANRVTQAGPRFSAV
jgi:hypothetical protein